MTQETLEMTQADYDNLLRSMRQEFSDLRRDAFSLGFQGDFRTACWKAAGSPPNTGPTEWLSGAWAVLEAQAEAAAELHRQEQTEAAEAALRAQWPHFSGKLA